jgi:hypothetical protein
MDFYSLFAFALDFLIVWITIQIISLSTNNDEIGIQTQMSIPEVGAQPAEDVPQPAKDVPQPAEDVPQPVEGKPSICKNAVRPVIFITPHTSATFKIIIDLIEKFKSITEKKLEANQQLCIKALLAIKKTIENKDSMKFAVADYNRYLNKTKLPYEFPFLRFALDPSLEDAILERRGIVGSTTMKDICEAGIAHDTETDFAAALAEKKFPVAKAEYSSIVCRTKKTVCCAIFAIDSFILNIPINRFDLLVLPRRITKLEDYFKILIFNCMYCSKRIKVSKLYGLLIDYAARASLPVERVNQVKTYLKEILAKNIECSDSYRPFNPKIARCRNQHCKKYQIPVLHFENYDLSADSDVFCVVCNEIHNSEMHIHSCDVCNTETCCICRGVHPRRPCPGIFNPEDGLDADTLLLLAETTRSCPSCNQRVTKTEGCDHMQCTCGTHFCYRCGQQLSSDMMLTYVHACPLGLDGERDYHYDDALRADAQDRENQELPPFF